MQTNELIEACLSDITDYMKEDRDREASRRLMVFIEERFKERDLLTVNAFLTRCREDKGLALTPRHKVTVLRTCLRFRRDLSEYSPLLRVWRQELDDAGMSRMLVGIGHGRES
ncbi:hypothetical protein pEaSNUABM37_00286 [Erwinia phage pEa_SNUABM_37]|nr:hypothetical protein pEaSNUABM37_00286 [Erwinia phage pEa_SNUABM_37]QXO10754.1 hypothetical protein pEaSNUABM48_00286 [Erwinia phage pEa_SNUABM_48]